MESDLHFGDEACSDSQCGEHEYDFLLVLCAVLTASIIRPLLMEVVSTSETSVNFCETTRRSISEDSHLRDICMFT
jgi:hypothetical protein